MCPRTIRAVKLAALLLALCILCGLNWGIAHHFGRRQVESIDRADSPAGEMSFYFSDAPYPFLIRSGFVSDPNPSLGPDEPAVKVSYVNRRYLYVWGLSLLLWEERN